MRHVSAIYYLNNTFFSLALAVTFALNILIMSYTEANGTTCTTSSAPGTASSIDSQLERTAEKLSRIPVNTYARDARLGKVMVETARMFLGTPYVPGTLEKDEESLVIKFDGYDCATFVDTVLALSRSLLLAKDKAAIPETFIEELRNIR